MHKMALRRTRPLTEVVWLCVILICILKDDLFLIFTIAYFLQQHVARNFKFSRFTGILLTFQYRIATAFICTRLLVILSVLN